MAVIGLIQLANNAAAVVNEVTIMEGAAERKADDTREMVPPLLS